MSKVFRPYPAGLDLTLPPSLQEWLTADHEVYFVADLTNALDLSDIDDAYREGRGYPRHPAADGYNARHSQLRDTGAGAAGRRGFSIAVRR